MEEEDETRITITLILVQPFFFLGEAYISDSWGLFDVLYGFWSWEKKNGG